MRGRGEGGDEIRHTLTINKIFQIGIYNEKDEGNATRDKKQNFVVVCTANQLCNLSYKERIFVL